MNGRQIRNAVRMEGLLAVHGRRLGLRALWVGWVGWAGWVDGFECFGLVSDKLSWTYDI